MSVEPLHDEEVAACLADAQKLLVRKQRGLRNRHESLPISFTIAYKPPKGIEIVSQTKRGICHICEIVERNLPYGPKNDVVQSVVDANGLQNEWQRCIGQYALKRFMIVAVFAQLRCKLIANRLRLAKKHRFTPGVLFTDLTCQFSLRKEDWRR